MNESVDLKRIKALPRCQTGEVYEEILPLATFERLDSVLVGEKGPLRIKFEFRREAEAILLLLLLQAELFGKVRRTVI